ncbi:MAG: hypothetical protein ACRD0N_16195, partial [Acidimicrobiales bacterium]
ASGRPIGPTAAVPPAAARLGGRWAVGVAMAVIAGSLAYSIVGPVPSSQAGLPDAVELLEVWAAEARRWHEAVVRPGPGGARWVPEPGRVQVASCARAGATVISTDATSGLLA